MTHKKFSDKFKIIAAVLAVVAVAAAAVAFTALSSNGSAAQDALSAGQASRAAISGVSIYESQSNEFWSTDPDNPTVIGSANSAPIESLFNVTSQDNIENIQVVGVRDSGEEITEGIEVVLDGSYSSISLTQAGTYTAVVTMDTGASARYYAKIGVVILPSPTTDWNTNNVYNGSSWTVNVSVAGVKAALLSQVFTMNATGVDCAGESVDVSATANSNGFSVTFTDAGTYTVSLELKDNKNYVWQQGASTTVQFTLKQAVAEVSFGELLDQVYSPDMTVASLKAGITCYCSNSTNHTIGHATVELYSNSVYTQVLTQADIKAGARIYVKAVALVEAAAGDKTYRNFVLPTTGITDSFRLTARSINAPAIARTGDIMDYYDSLGIFNDKVPKSTDNSITATYFNYDYKIWHWFNQTTWSNSIDNNGYAEGAYWKVTVNGSVIDNIETFSMKNKGTYTVKIEPKDNNFTFGSQNSYTFNFSISPYNLMYSDFEWNNEKHVYSGNPISFSGNDCTFKTFAGEDLTVVLARIEGGNEINESPVNAGTYTYKIKSLSGASKDNYVLDGSGIQHVFTIYRKMLPDFKNTVGTVVTGTFNGEKQRFSIHNMWTSLGLAVDGEDQYLIRVKIIGDASAVSYPEAWGLGNATKTVTTAFEYGSGDHYFPFTNAGNYSVTFYIAEAAFRANHCFFGGDDNPGVEPTSYVWTDFAKIERVEIDPSLANTDLNTNDDYVDLSAFIANRFSAVNGTNIYTLTYGDGTTTSAAPLDKDNSGKYMEGDYTLLVSIANGFYPDCYFKAPTDDEYAVNGNEVTLRYSVTASSVRIKCEVTPYTFGDSFASGFGVNDVVTVNKSGPTGTTFGAQTIAFYTDSQCTQAAVLYNGVPRNAGEYYVKVAVDYAINNASVGNDSGTWERVYSLTVSKRQVTLEWKLDGVTKSEASVNLTYANETHNVTVANITSAISGVTNPTAVLNETSAINAGTHVFTVTGLSGAEGDNYTLDGVENISFTLNIARVAITVTANDVSDVTYGEVLTLSPSAYGITGAFLNNENNGQISVAVYDKNGNLVDPVNYASLARGSYRAVPVWGTVPNKMPVLTDNKYVVNLDNYDVTMVADGFRVISKGLIVTIYSGMYTQYGDTVDLYVPYKDGKGVYSTNVEMTVEEFKQLVIITATNGGVSATDLYAAVGQYTLNATSAQTDSDYSDYEVKFQNPDGSEYKKSAYYEITRRQVTLQTNDVSAHPYGTLLSESYEGYTEIGDTKILDKDRSIFNDLLYSVRTITKNHASYKWTDVTGSLTNCNVGGEYYYVANLGINVQTVLRACDDGSGRFYYTKDNYDSHYSVTVITGNFTIVPREITITFSETASVEYGTSIDYWEQESGLSGRELYSNYIYCSCLTTDLRYSVGWETGDLIDNLSDVIDLTLVKANGDAFNGNAGEYKFKATIKNSNYVIKNGQNDGQELTGGKFNVTPKNITVTAVSSVASIIYGNDLPANALSFTVSGLINGDTKESLGLVVGIFSGSTDVTSTLSSQNAGSNYKVSVSECTNGNYSVTVTEADFAIAKRPAKVTPTNVTNHVYGEALSGNLTFVAEARSETRGFISDAHWQALGITASLSGDASSLSVGDHTITLTKTSDNTNYDIQLETGTFTVVKRTITLTFGNGGTSVYGETVDLYKAISSTTSLPDDIKAVITLTATKGSDNAAASKAPVGDYTVTASVSAAYSTNYKLADGTGTGVYAITKRTVKVKANDVTHTYGDDFSLSSIGYTITSDSAYTVLDGDNLGVTAKVLDGLTEIKVFTTLSVKTGGYTIRPVSCTNTNYTIVSVDGTFTVAQRAITLTFGNGGTSVYGETVDLYKAISSTTSLPDDIKAVITLTATKDSYNATAAKAPVGDYTVTASISAAYSTNYKLADGTSTGVYTITKRTVKIKANDVTHTYGDDFSLSSIGYTTASDSLYSVLDGDNLGVTAKVLDGLIEVTVFTTLSVKTDGYVISPVDCTNANYEIISVDGTFTVAQRAITLTFGNGGTSVYGETVDLYNAISNVTNLLDADSIRAVVTLTATKGSDNAAATKAPVGDYTVTASISAAYSTNYKLADGTGTGVYTITKRTVKIKANDVTHTYGDDFSLSSIGYTITSDSAYTVLDGDNLGVTAKVLDGLTEVEVFTTLSVKTGGYTISPVDCTNSNYAIVSVDGTFTVAKRTITATLVESQVEYTEDMTGGSVNYHDGVYGAEHNAVVNFGNLVSGGDTLSINNGYALSYSTEAIGSWQEAGKAPRHVGKYQVTVTLNSANYAFADGATTATLDFEVTPKAIDASQISWNKKTIEYDKDVNHDNFVVGYIPAIMQTVSVIETTAQQINHNQPGTPLSLGNSSTVDSYYFDGNGILHIVAYNRAEYKATLSFNSDAQANYKFSNLQARSGSIEVAFYIITENVILTVNASNWRYLDNINNETFNVLVTGSEPEIGFRYAFAPVKAGADIEQLLLKKQAADYGGLDEKDVGGLFDTMTDIKFDPETGDYQFNDGAGYYIIRVNYNTFNTDSEDIVDTTKYDIVRVLPKQLSITKTLGSKTYNGKSQYQDIDFTMSNGENIQALVTATINGAEDNRIMGQNAGTYTAILTIKDTVLYTWADEMNANGDGEVTVTWTITKDTANNDDGKYFTVGAIESAAYGDSITKTNPTLKSGIGSGYGSSFIWYFASKGSLTNASDVNVSAWTEWTASVTPVNAGDYFVKVVLTDTSAGKINFTDKIGYGELTIDKKDLHITLSGTLEYGNAFNKNYCTYIAVTGDLINGDTANVIRVTSGMSYYLVDKNGTQLSNVSQLAVGSYNLTALTDDDDYVLGLAADNYNIVLADGYGVFTVTAKTITVKIGSTSGQYGLEPDLSKVGVTYDGTDSAIVIAGVRANLKSTAGKTSPVRDENYEIYSTYKNDNFVINYERGVYTVTPRVVTVTFNSGVGGIYGMTITPAKFTVDGTELAELVANEFSLKLVYNGEAFDKTKYENSETAPSHAGNFTASVIVGTPNKNFTLTLASIDFRIAKQTLDESKIKTDPSEKAYTGSAIDPTLNNAYSGLYRVRSHENFVELGNYKLQIELVDSNNYKWTVSTTAIAEVDFEIVPAGIKVIPHATFTYGGTFADATFSYVLVYALNGKPVEDGIVTPNEALIKYFVNDIKYNASKPQAGTYALEMERIAEGSDFVNGFTSNRYRVILEVGELVVEKYSITLTVRDSSSIYSQNIVLTNGYDVTDLVWDDKAEDVIKNYTITADPSSWRNATTYTVTASASADNYNISYKYGTHTIKPIEVTLVVNALDGIYKDKVVDVRVTAKTDSLSNYVFPDEFYTKLTKKFTDSTGYESYKLPENAGDYSVEVIGITDSNYKFISSTSDTFAIAKKVIYETKIDVTSKVYNGETQSHGIKALEGVYRVYDGVYKDAKVYNVTLELVDANNYTWESTDGKTVDVKFEITKATLTLYPRGSAVYGDGFDSSYCAYYFTGWQGTDEYKADAVKGNVTYSLVNAPDKLIVVKNGGGYDLIADTSNLISNNYEIGSEKGTFTVTPRPINIRPVATTSVYSQKPVTSNEFVFEAGSSLAYDDDISVIDYGNVMTTANINSGIGSYPVSASASAENYRVMVMPGTHTIEPIKVKVTMLVKHGVYDDKSNAGSVDFASVVATNLKDKPAIERLEFTLNFSGKSYSGNDLSQRTIPTVAGLYEVTIVGISNPNYVLDYSDGGWRSTIEIAKRTIDLSDIKVQTESYTGSAIRPKLTDNLGKAGIYTVNYGAGHASGFIEVGTYDLTLTLTDTYNYCWRDNLNAYATVKFEITKANNAIVDSKGNVSANAKIEIANWTIDDEASMPKIKLLNDEGEVTFEYSTSEKGIYTTLVPTTAGTYWVRAVVAASNNYNAFTSAPVSFVIKKRIVEMPSVVNDGASVYTGEMQSLNISNYDDRIMSLKCDLFTKNVDGTLTLSALNAGTYTAILSLRDTSSYVWRDNSNLVDGAVVITWTIERQVLKRLSNASSTIVVNGSDIVFTPDGFNSGIMTIEDNVHAVAGKYSAVVTLKDTVNYAWEGTDGSSIAVKFELVGTNVAFVASMCVIAGLCVGLAAMAVILTFVSRRRKRREEEAIEARSRADGWEG